MLRRLSALAIAVFVLGFAYGQREPMPMEPSILDLVRPVYDAFASGRYALMGALAVILLVAAIKKWFGTQPSSWLHSDAGGSGLALAGAASTALAAGLVAPGARITLSLLETALGVGVTAAGGYAMLKNLLVDPLLRPLAKKAPLWAQPGFQLVFWVFDKPTPVAVAVAAGDAAVAAAPGPGVSAAAGSPTDVK